MKPLLDRGGSRSNFFHFYAVSAKILPNNSLLLKTPEVGPTPHLGNPGSATGSIRYVTINDTKKHMKMNKNGSKGLKQLVKPQV